eukprot:gene11440-11586_t
MDVSLSCKKKKASVDVYEGLSGDALFGTSPDQGFMTPEAVQAATRMGRASRGLAVQQAWLADREVTVHRGSSSSRVLKGVRFRALAVTSIDLHHQEL